MKVMFVCLGNICRSPLSQAVFEKILDDNENDEIEADSSGTSAYHIGEQSDPRMRETAKHHGVPIRHRAQQLTKAHLQEFDLVLAMDHSNFRNIQKLAGNNQALRNKVRLLREFDPQGGPDAEVPDPYYGGPQGFEEVFDIVSRSCRNLYRAIVKGEIADGTGH